MWASLNEIAAQVRTEPHAFGRAKLCEDFLGELNENLARHRISRFVCAVSTILLQTW
jgi:hypothetical protein